MLHHGYIKFHFRFLFDHLLSEAIKCKVYNSKLYNTNQNETWYEIYRNPPKMTAFTKPVDQGSFTQDTQLWYQLLYSKELKLNMILISFTSGKDWSLTSYQSFIAFISQRILFLYRCLLCITKDTREYISICKAF